LSEEPEKLGANCPATLWNLQKRFRRGRAAFLAQSIPFIAQESAAGNPSV
jgi:hypothetical protein